MEKFVEVFGLNWKLLIAQLVNFSVLVFILGKFVYKPIVKALDNRRHKIEEGIAFSDKAKIELAQIEVKKVEEMKKAELAGQAVIKKAEENANTVSNTILATAEKDKERIIEAGKNILLERKATMEKNFYQEAAGVVKEALTKVLAKGKFDKEEDALVVKALSEIKK